MRTRIIVALVAVILTTACGDNNVTGPDNRFSAEEAFDYMVLSQGRDRLVLIGVNGTVEIEGVNGASEISIRGTRRVQARTQAEADVGLGELAVEIDSSGTDVQVRTEQPTDGRTYIVDYQVTLPSDFVVHAVNGNGDVTLAALESEVFTQCANGSVTFDVVGGFTRIEVGNGAIVGALTLPAGGTAHLQLGNGSIVLQIPQSTSADFAASVGNGTITINNLTLTDVTQTPTSLTGTLGGGDGFIELGIGNGPITVNGT